VAIQKTPKRHKRTAPDPHAPKPEARPKRKRPNRVLEHQLNIRVSEEERKAWMDAAGKRGLAEWVRHTCNGRIARGLGAGLTTGPTPEQAAKVAEAQAKYPPPEQPKPAAPVRSSPLAALLSRLPASRKVDPTKPID